MRLLLLLLLASAVSCRMNACGSDVSKYTNYLDINVDVPIDQVADMFITFRSSVPRQFVDLMDKDQYWNGRVPEHNYLTDRFSETGLVKLPWTEISNGIRTRSLSVPTDDRLTVDEIQTINDTNQTAESVVILKFKIHTFSSYQFTTVTCVAPGTIYQIDGRVSWIPSSGLDPVFNPAYEEMRQSMELSFAKTHNDMGDLLKKMEACHQNYPYELIFARQNEKSGKSITSGRFFQYKKTAPNGSGAYWLIALAYLIAGLY